MPTTDDALQGRALRGRLLRGFLQHRDETGLGSDEQVMIAFEALARVWFGLAREAVRTQDQPVLARLEWFLAIVNSQPEHPLDG